MARVCCTRWSDDADVETVFAVIESTDRTSSHCLFDSNANVLELYKIQHMSLVQGWHTNLLLRQTELLWSEQDLEEPSISDHQQEERRIAYPRSGLFHQNQMFLDMLHSPERSSKMKQRHRMRKQRQRPEG